MDWNTRYLPQWWDTDSKVDSAPVEDASRFKWLEYVKNSRVFDSVELDYYPITKTSEFILRKSDFQMKLRTPLSAIDSKIMLEIDEMINNFIIITSPLNRSSTRYDGFYARAMADDAVKKYIEEDINMEPKHPTASRLMMEMYGIKPISIKLEIKDVIFNDPATIVIWSDGTKTVVKAQNGETYDREKGFAMALAKKFLGNQGNYYETMKKWLK